MRTDKTLSELWNLVEHEDKEVSDTAKMAIDTIGRLKETYAKVLNRKDQQIADMACELVTQDEKIKRYSVRKEDNMTSIYERKGIPVQEFNIGDKAMLANPHLLVQSLNKEDDTFTVVETELSFGKWKSAINDRTGYGYVMANGDYCLL
ncbi:hypothetical protein [Cytobacillus praedii]|uniref:Uncharacterized protein n=1 Tax=Cytobacillus praedii TaxID=1742358 RepID=A0A4R1AR22_9BACI|nr:hypothetical protein [Cytobacillus praedii]TCJ00447.1 hypothetical protein E0Y62_26820 [Cytobacillus praedii]